jgi:tetratricopeptide (TPR) repeat protein
MRFIDKQGWRALRVPAGALALVVVLAAGSAADAGVTSSTDRVKLRSQLGIIYAQNNQVEDAKKEFVRLLEEPTGRAAALTNLGNLAMLDGKVDVALENYDQAAALDTVDAGILLNLGLAHKEAGHDDEAARVFAVALTKAGGADKAAELLGVRMDADTSKGKVSKLSNEEIKAMLAKARARVPEAGTKPASATEKPQVVSRPGGARAADVSVGATSLYWKEK